VVIKIELSVRNQIYKLKVHSGLVNYFISFIIFKVQITLPLDNTTHIPIRGKYNFLYQL